MASSSTDCAGFSSFSVTRPWELLGRRPTAHSASGVVPGCMAARRRWGAAIGLPNPSFPSVGRSEAHGWHSLCWEEPGRPTGTVSPARLPHCVRYQDVGPICCGSVALAQTASSATSYVPLCALPSAVGSGDPSPSYPALLGPALGDSCSSQSPAGHGPLPPWPHQLAVPSTWP